MTTIEILVMRKELPKYLRNRYLSDKCNAVNLEKFAETALQSEFFLDDRILENLNGTVVI